jgi:hypothetical protein
MIFARLGIYTRLILHFFMSNVHAAISGGGLLITGKLMCVTGHVTGSRHISYLQQNARSRFPIKP